MSHVDVSTPKKWCEYYGVEYDDTYALVFKAVGPNFATTQRGFAYVPGTTPSAPDWDGGEQECGRGLHFSPSPGHAEYFHDSLVTVRFVACPVLLTEVAVHPDGDYPEKVKAPRVALPCWEVDRGGKPVEGAVVTWRKS